MAFIVEQYELHLITYRVETGTDQAGAIEKVLAGEGDPIDNSSEFVDVAYDYGMSLFDNPDLACRLFERGLINGDDTIVRSIRSCEEVPKRTNGEEHERRPSHRSQ